jgi:integrase
MKTHLTERNAKALEPGPKNIILVDDEVVGFGLRVTPAGARAFVLSYNIHGRARRITIGSWPDWSVVAARERAKELKREIDQGHDPLAVRIEARAAATIRDLIDRYIVEHGPKLAARNCADQVSILRKFVEPVWGSRKVDDITHEDVDHLLAEVAKGRPRSYHAKGRTKAKRVKAKPPGIKPSPIRSNRVGEVLRKMFNLAIRWRMRADNPAQGFARVPEQPRERYLSRDEMERITNVISTHPNRRAADVIRLLMLTGARRGEAMNASWEQFDLETALWIKPAATTKQRRLDRTPLSGAAVALLRVIRERVPKDCPWVFPGDAKGKPLIEIKRFWDEVREQADLPDFRIHDLRHTFASLLVSGGMSLPMIGKLLGHTQVQTTLRYAHLFDDPLRAGLDHVGDLLRPKLKLVQTEAATSDDNLVTFDRR